MSPALVLVFYVLVFIRGTTAQDIGHFSNPPTGGKVLNFRENLVWTIGDKQTIKWTSIYDSFNIELWQQNLATGAGLLGPSIFAISPLNSITVTEFDWNVDVFQFDIRVSNVYFLWLKPVPYKGQLSATSHYFNLSQKASSITSKSTSAAISTSISHASTEETTSLTTSISTTSAVSSSLGTVSPVLETSLPSTNTPTTGHDVSLVLGSVFGVVAVFLLAGVSFWFYRKKKKRTRAREQSISKHKDHQDAEQPVLHEHNQTKDSGSYLHAQQPLQPPHTYENVLGMSSHAGPVEMPSHRQSLRAVELS
ncbi:hypothetical protein BJ875DRAFT_487427 [Amylocarpus encephaloides]|uniref:Mid2 domain-containing protein n=1 Tax=Amylocarpus encephaloides TaxID=45428 RepID=A0A9P7YC39_9HELO|nr:hypothetical protein BJ875DRAFT_487427 [Amylocarpus encephaloides]